MWRQIAFVSENALLRYLQMHVRQSSLLRRSASEDWVWSGVTEVDKAVVGRL